MQDIELMHMRYALESTVLALGAMGRSMNGEKETHQVALCHLQDLKNHLAGIKNIPRKVFCYGLQFLKNFCFLAGVNVVLFFIDGKLQVFFKNLYWIVDYL